MFTVLYRLTAIGCVARNVYRWRGIIFK